MKLKNFVRGSVAAFVATAALNSNAGIVYVDLRGHDGNMGHSANVYDQRRNVTIEAFWEDGAGNVFEDDVVQSGGMGTAHGSDKIDNNTAGSQWLSFSVDRGTIVGALLIGFGTNEEAHVWTNAESDASGLGTQAVVFSTTSRPAIAWLSMPFVGNWFSVGTSDGLSASRFQVAGLKVDVPEPATFGLTLAALVGGFFARRRAARTTA